MGLHFLKDAGAAALIRPRLVIQAARAGAAGYQRRRDLPGALAGSGRGIGNGSRTAIIARLTEVELGCEELRRARSPAYRPGRHVQVLAALLAESATGQAKASGSEALRVST